MTKKIMKKNNNKKQHAKLRQIKNQTSGNDLKKLYTLQ